MKSCFAAPTRSSSGRGKSGNKPITIKPLRAGADMTRLLLARHIASGRIPQTHA
ncbi:hypothetical protein Thi970DRAFT_03462 [Thiorhodovibrio frisius]|uniref:Uncharacterized protein n=1 Tax=Thiorhodovibrio frisius TaxID=631362 RepID=H8Z7E1_9GAMM|nr:hypothetical protein Thi970DRAFT_03462 [Thiorhodovibrio frisius]WPL20585.1 hypothetical protein Thiofri_00684 [Thiorhodovibrio frisius]